jgi:hypothetical protein
MRHSRFISSTPLTAGLLTGSCSRSWLFHLTQPTLIGGMTSARKSRSPGPYRACSTNPPRE